MIKNIIFIVLFISLQNLFAQRKLNLVASLSKDSIFDIESFEVNYTFRNTSKKAAKIVIDYKMPAFMQIKKPLNKKWRTVEGSETNLNYTTIDEFSNRTNYDTIFLKKKELSQKYPNRYYPYYFYPSESNKKGFLYGDYIFNFPGKYEIRLGKIYFDKYKNRQDTAFSNELILYIKEYKNDFDKEAIAWVKRQPCSEGKYTLERMYLTIEQAREFVSKFPKSSFTIEKEILLAFNIIGEAEVKMNGKELVDLKECFEECNRIIDKYKENQNLKNRLLTLKREMESAELKYQRLLKEKK